MCSAGSRERPPGPGPAGAVCEECDGKRYTPEVLGYTLRGKNISEVLGTSVAGAHDFFPAGQAHAVLGRLAGVGLGYLRLGQPLNTLSGAEPQRLKPAIHMAEKAATYLLDEPTRGCTWPTSTSCWRCWTGWSTTATRWWSSNTTRPSWRAPTG